MEGVLNLKFGIKETKMSNDEFTIIRAKRGNKEAFTNLIKDNKEYLYKLAYTYVKDENKSLDVLQECIFRTFKSIKNLKEPKYFKTWITRILINCAMDYVKKENKTDYIEFDENLAGIDENIALEEKLDLYNAIDRLRPEFKTVIILKYFNDYSVKEISEIMQVSDNTIKSHLNRARKSLKKILKEEI